MRAARVALTAAILVSVALSAAGVAEAKTAKSYYLSLGDSLSVGVQPKSDGKNANTKHGYPR